MKQESLLYGIIGLLAGSLLTVMVASNSVNNNYAPMMKMMGMRTQNYSQGTMMSANIDQHFIEQMIPHHEDAITMSKLALEKSKRPEIKILAQNIISSQSKEIEQMKKWYRDWFERELPTGSEVMNQHGMMGRGGMHMGARGGESDLSLLSNAENFDIAFIEEMIPHHQMAVMMASMLKNGTQRLEMKKLAEDIVTAQSDEIDQMRKWLSEWE